MKKKEQKIVDFFSMLLVFLIFVFVFALIFQQSIIGNLRSRNNYLEGFEEKYNECNSYIGIDYETWQEIEADIIDDSTYNFQVMRDIFTPMNNDNVTVENAGYDNGWVFWVNHSRVLYSYHFKNMNDYLMRFNSSTDRIELVKGR